MKKLFNILTAVALAVVAITAMTACSDDDKDRCYFTLGIDETNISGSSSDFSGIYKYMNEVSDAYYKVLGMSESNNSVIIEGDYKKIAAEMADKFNSAVLPAEYQWSAGTYSFKMVLRGCNLKNGTTELEDMNVVASKTFAK